MIAVAELAPWRGLTTAVGICFSPIDEGTGAATRPWRILIAEDDYFVAMQTEDALKNAGFEIVGTAKTATEAIDLARTLLPDLVIMDIRLASQSDGVAAALEIKQQLGIRSIFATAHSDERTRARATLAQPAGWLFKPFTDAALVETVQAALQS